MTILSIDTIDAYIEEAKDELLTIAEEIRDARKYRYGDGESDRIAEIIEIVERVDTLQAERTALCLSVPANVRIVASPTEDAEELREGAVLARKPSTAEEIAARFRHGARDASGTRIEAVIAASRGEMTTDMRSNAAPHVARRWEFPDGSALVCKDNRWGVGFQGSDCFCFRDDGRHDDWCPDDAQVAARKAALTDA